MWAVLPEGETHEYHSAHFLQMQMQMQIFSPLHSASAVVGEVIVGM